MSTQTTALIHAGEVTWSVSQMCDFPSASEEHKDVFCPNVAAGECSIPSCRDRGPGPGCPIPELRDLQMEGPRASLQ